MGTKTQKKNMEKCEKLQISKNQKNGTLLAVLGSGGHTSEMLKLVEAFNDDMFIERTFVYAKTDIISPRKLKDLNNQNFHTYEIPRSREVGQSWLTTIFYTFYAFLCCLSVILRKRPKLVLVNGPGTCVPIVLATRLLSLFGLFKTQIVYVESICRVKTLSLSAKLLMALRILDVIIVQWPELALKFPKTKYIGKIL